MIAGAPAVELPLLLANYKPRLIGAK